MPLDPTLSLPRLRLGRLPAGQRQRSPHSGGTARSAAVGGSPTPEAGQAAELLGRSSVSTPGIER